VNRTRTAAAVLAMALFGVGPAETARAQEPANRFDELATRLKPGDTIWVTDAQGRELKGRMLELTSSQLVFQRGHLQTLEADAIRLIRKRGRRPVLRAAGIGAIIGTLAAIPSALREEGDCEWSLDPMTSYCAGDEFLMAGALIGGGIGAGIGAMIPGKRRVVYRAPGAPAG
jgi:hypothetical protein